MRKTMPAIDRASTETFSFSASSSVRFQAGSAASRRLVFAVVEMEEDPLGPGEGRDRLRRARRGPPARRSCGRPSARTGAAAAASRRAARRACPSRRSPRRGGRARRPRPTPRAPRCGPARSPRRPARGRRPAPRPAARRCPRPTSTASASSDEEQENVALQPGVGRRREAPGRPPPGSCPAPRAESPSKKTQPVASDLRRGDPQRLAVHQVLLDRAGGMERLQRQPLELGRGRLGQKRPAHAAPAEGGGRARRHGQRVALAVRGEPEVPHGLPGLEGLRDVAPRRRCRGRCRRPGAPPRRARARRPSPRALARTRRRARVRRPSRRPVPRRRGGPRETRDAVEDEPLELAARTRGRRDETSNQGLCRIAPEAVQTPTSRMAGRRARSSAISGASARKRAASRRAAAASGLRRGDERDRLLFRNLGPDVPVARRRSGATGRPTRGARPPAPPRPPRPAPRPPPRPPGPAARSTRRETRRPATSASGPRPRARRRPGRRRPPEGRSAASGSGRRRRCPAGGTRERSRASRRAAMLARGSRRRQKRSNGSAGH